MATQVILNNSIPEESYLELRFDHALLLQLGPTHDRMFGCARGEKSGWYVYNLIINVTSLCTHNIKAKSSRMLKNPDEELFGTSIFRVRTIEFLDIG